MSEAEKSALIESWRHSRGSIVPAEDDMPQAARWSLHVGGIAAARAEAAPAAPCGLLVQAPMGGRAALPVA